MNSSLPWKRPADQLPVDDAEVFAAICWEENPPSGTREYGIHDCSFYRGGPGSGQAIFADSEGEEFEAKDVAFWIYKTELSASVPQIAYTKKGCAQHSDRFDLECLRCRLMPTEEIVLSRPIGHPINPRISHLIGNLLTRWEQLTNDFKSVIDEQEREFFAAMHELVNAVDSGEFWTLIGITPNPAAVQSPAALATAVPVGESGECSTLPASRIGSAIEKLSARGINLKDWAVIASTDNGKMVYANNVDIHFENLHDLLAAGSFHAHKHGPARSTEFEEIK